MQEHTYILESPQFKAFYNTLKGYYYNKHQDDTYGVDILLVGQCNDLLEILPLDYGYSLIDVYWDYPTHIPDYIDLDALIQLYYKYHIAVTTLPPSMLTQSFKVRLLNSDGLVMIG